jgi:large subunit ribosomal protein L44e
MFFKFDLRKLVISDPMEYPKQIRTYCKYCKKYTLHNVKLFVKKPERTLAIGYRRHERKIKGYVGKVKGKVPVKKQGKRQVVILECTVCHKKTQRS